MVSDRFWPIPTCTSRGSIVVQRGFAASTSFQMLVLIFNPNLSLICLLASSRLIARTVSVHEGAQDHLSTRLLDIPEVLHFSSLSLYCATLVNVRSWPFSAGSARIEYFLIGTIGAGADMPLAPLCVNIVISPLPFTAPRTGPCVERLISRL